MVALEVAGVVSVVHRAPGRGRTGLPRPDGARPTAWAALSLLLAAALAACSGSDPPEPPPPPPDPVRPTPEGMILADEISFLPAVLTSARQYRPNLVVSGDELFFTDGSDAPLKKVSTSGGPVAPLARRMGSPRLVAVRGDRVVWTVDDKLVETSPDPVANRILAEGNDAPTPDLLVDDTGVYWVRTDDSALCAPPCGKRIERVEEAGTVPLVDTDEVIAGIAQDATHVYWVEHSSDVFSPGCDCGSTVRRVPKAGGAPTVLVDGTLNGGFLADPPPGYLAVSWAPVGGIATDGSYVYFAHSQLETYRVVRVPVGGGAIEVITEFPATPSDLGEAPRRFALDATRLYWIDSSSLRAAPLSGGPRETIADGLDAPIGLVLDGESAFVVEDASWWGGGTVRRIPLDGEAVTVVLSGLDMPGSLALDGSRVYWTEHWRLGAAPRSGGPTRTLASGIEDAYFRIVVVGDDVLVVDGPLVKRVPKGGGTLEKLLELRIGGDVLALEPQDATTDGQAIYLVDRVRGPTANWVTRVPVDGSATTGFTKPGWAYSQDCVVRVAVDAEHVYWTGGSESPLFCTIERAPISGGEAVTLVDAPLYDFALDAGDVYFTETQIVHVGGGGTEYIGEYAVRAVSVEGGPIRNVLETRFPFLVAVADGMVFWTDPPRGLVSWARKDGTDVGLLEAGYFEADAWYADALTSDGTSVYWTNSLYGYVGKLTLRWPAAEGAAGAP
jgi:hypothetical protein